MSGFNLKISGLDKSLANINKLRVKLDKQVNDEVNAFGLNTVNDAKRLCPVDEGFLRNSITYASGINKRAYTVEIIAAANYAAYVEFGTRRFAAQYVATLPAEWQEFAAKFKGEAGGGTFEEFVNRIFEWMKRKGIKGGTYSVKSRRRKGSKEKKENEDKSLAYAIAVKLTKEGIKPRKFFVPSVEKNKKELIKNLQTVLK